MVAETALRPPPSAATDEAGPDRLAAFAFAAVGLMVETDPGGQIAFLAGTLLPRLGTAALGGPLRALVAPEDRPGLEGALARLAAEGRLPPLVLRLACPGHPPQLLNGLRLPGARLALCFTALPEPMAMPQAAEPCPAPAPSPAPGEPGLLARRAEATLREGEAGTVLSLMELSGADGRISPRPALARDVAAALADHAGPDGVAAQLAPGRFGVLGPAGDASLGAVVERLQAILGAAGLSGAAVSAQTLPLADPESAGLSGPQAVRALRLALGTFAQGGAAALARAGFEEGLHGFVAAAGRRSAALGRAVAGRRFSLAYQPIVALGREGRPAAHYEALIRPWPGEPGVPHSPQDFVTLAEMLGLAVELDLAVVQSTLLAMEQGDTALRLACNISGLSLQDGGFRARLLALLDATPPALRRRLLLEVTETAEIEDEVAAAATCSALRERGVVLCVDDFGAGAAGLSYLRLLRPALVKLDGRLVTGLDGPARAEDRAFVTALVELAHALGAEVVAERIETEADAAVALGFGARYGQGWLFGRPGRLPGHLSGRALQAE
ncbi:hypothetical protein CR165_13280 [Pseudoroseomonas aestuarii]|uniref:EAL domain-containing protein n=1 Tax=Teichococcus aestuarii TaxID=568898 RepID=A0A2U1V328_9PROT|nr:hypothetical protein CR165_13280 [Pseudoroseomonas aestuarii]